MIYGILFILLFAFMHDVWRDMKAYHDRCTQELDDEARRRKQR